MQTKISPYELITPEIATSNLLISIKQAAERNECCEGTLKANAKSRRLRGYQSHFGSPVMVLPDDVEEFLKSRSDIASKYHPKSSSTISTAERQITVSKPQPYYLSPFPDEEDSYYPIAIGDFGLCIKLRSLTNSLPCERALMVKVFFEIARAINDTVAADSANQYQN